VEHTNLKVDLDNIYILSCEDLTYDDVLDDEVFIGTEKECIEFYYNNETALVGDNMPPVKYSVSKIDPEDVDFYMHEFPWYAEKVGYILSGQTYPLELEQK